MKKYNKPKIYIEDFLAKETITALTVSTTAANYETVPQDTWAEWENLFN